MASNKIHLLVAGFFTFAGILLIVVGKPLLGAAFLVVGILYEVNEALAVRRRRTQAQRQETDPT